MFSGSSYPRKLTAMLYDHTGSGKSNMAAAKPEVPVSHPTYWRKTQLQMSYLYYSGPAVKWDGCKCSELQLKLALHLACARLAHNTGCGMLLTSRSLTFYTPLFNFVSRVFGLLVALAVRFPYARRAFRNACSCIRLRWQCTGVVQNSVNC
jgi:hypothetical protein